MKYDLFILVKTQFFELRCIDLTFVGSFLCVVYNIIILSLHRILRVQVLNRNLQLYRTCNKTIALTNVSVEMARATKNYLGSVKNKITLLS